MTRRELIRAVYDLLKDNDVRKEVSIPKQVLHITDDEGNSKDFSIKRTDKKILFTVGDIEEILNAYFYVVEDALKRGDQVSVQNFGTFALHYRKPRMSRSVATGEEIFVPGRHIPKFWPGLEMKRACKVYDLMVAEHGSDPAVAEVGYDYDDDEDEDEDDGYDPEADFK